MSRSFRNAASGTGLALTLGLGTLLSPAVAAAAASITFGHDDTGGLVVGTHCLTGHAASSATATIVWRSTGGTLKSSGSFATSPYGNWDYCDAGATLAIGDTLKLKDGSAKRTFTVPRVTLIVDRVNDNFRGLAPANSVMTVWSHCCFSDYYDQEDVTSDGTGHWFYSYGYDVPGGTDVWVDWHGALGDAITVNSTAPQVDVIVGSSRFDGSATPNAAFRVALRDGVTNALRGIGETTATEYGGVNGRFLDINGHPVAVAVGDRVVGHSLASDLDWIVPDASAVANVANDTVQGSCEDAGNLTETAVVTVHRTGRERGFALANVQTDGTFEVDFRGSPDFLFNPANIKHGDLIRVACWLDTGDAVLQSFLVP